MNNRRELMAQAQANRTHDEHLRVINRRMAHMQAAIDESMTMAIKLADQFELLKSDVNFYQEKWGIKRTPLGQFSSREQPDWQDGFNKRDGYSG